MCTAGMIMCRRGLAWPPNQVPRERMIDLVGRKAPFAFGYHKHAGGLDNVATVLAELADALSSAELLAVAKLSPAPWAQRLGYLLEFVGAGQKASLLARHVERAVIKTVPLLAGKPLAGDRRDPRWKLNLNVDVEPDT